jgi:hypothetical protein
MGFWKAITDRGAKIADAATRLGALDVSARVEAPPAVVWDILIDTRTWSEWGPSVAEVELDHDGPRIDAGSSGRVRTAAGIWMAFEVTEWEDGARWTWDVEGVRATGHRVEAGDEEWSRVVFEVPYVAAPYAAVCRSAATRIVELAEGRSA